MNWLRSRCVCGAVFCAAVLMMSVPERAASHGSTGDERSSRSGRQAQQVANPSERRIFENRTDGGHHAQCRVHVLPAR